MKTIAIIGAGEAALPIINKAREMGVRSLAFGRLDSFAKDLVDIFIEENSFDIDFMKSECLKHNVNGIMASSEMTTAVAATLAHGLNLPGNSVEGGFAGKNKYEMRKRVSTVSSIRQPKFELYQDGKDYSFPIIVKSVDACGKRGVSLVRDKAEFEVALNLAQDNSSDGSALIEEYLCGGQEYSIECLSSGSIHDVVQYTEKESSGPPHFVEIAHHQPAALTDEMKSRIKQAVSDVLDVLGLTCGMAHFEMKIIDNELYFIEVGARHGGDHIGDTLTLLSTDCDYFRQAILCALGEYQHQEVNCKGYAGIYFHCEQNKGLDNLFKKARNADWCYADTVKKDEFDAASSNVESANSGYIIYHSDHRITMNNEN